MSMELDLLGPARGKIPFCLLKLLGSELSYDMHHILV